MINVHEVEAKEWVVKFLKDNKLVTITDNLYEAPKAFKILRVARWAWERKKKGRLSDSKFETVLDYISRYAIGEIELELTDGMLSPKKLGTSSGKKRRTRIRKPQRRDPEPAA